MLMNFGDIYASINATKIILTSIGKVLFQSGGEGPVAATELTV